MKFIKNILYSDKFRSIFFVALAHLILFNSSIIAYKFLKTSFSIKVIFALFVEIILNILAMLILFAGLSINRRIFIISSIVLFICSATSTYYFICYSITPSTEIIASLFNSTTGEFLELIDPKIIIWNLFCLIILLIILFKNNFHNKYSRYHILTSIFCLIITIKQVIHPISTSLDDYIPFKYLHNSYRLLLTQKSNLQRNDITQLFKFNYEEAEKDELIGVFVIGETARYDHFGINGYERDTTPVLSKIDLASYKTRSCANSTLVSLPCMLSRFGESQREEVDTENTMLSVFKGLGFSTYWLSTQYISKGYRNRAASTFYDEVDVKIIPGETIIKLPIILDCDLLPYLETYIGNEKKQFIVMHTLGSHWHYSNRYDETHAKFKPEVKMSFSRIFSNKSENYTKTSDDSILYNSSRQEKINSYDNSILYTDYFLSEVIERLKDKTAFFIYSSDHGESLGENGVYFHSSELDPIEQREVPTIIWVSDKFKAKYKDKWDNIKSREKEYISHDHLFHTILDCMNVKSDIIDKKLSLCARKN